MHSLVLSKGTNEKITLADKGPFENARILCKLDENARILLKMHKTKFSEIELASSKGISSKDPISVAYLTTYCVFVPHLKRRNVYTTLLIIYISASAPYGCLLCTT